jgi:stage II sporulation protein AB (anti-sigma F factor)
MKPVNMMKTQFISRSANESYARVAVAAFCAQLDPTMEEIADIKTAVSEAVTNSIVHGYSDKLGIITVTAKIYDNRYITVTVKDKGRGIENIAQAMEPLFTTDTTGERSGMGFAIMETLMDKLKVKSTPGKGTTVIMSKILSSRN